MFYVSGGIMGKIIVITFAFMVFAFYQLSDGADFVPIADEKRAALQVEKAEETRLLAQAKAEALERQPKPEIILASAVVTPVVQADEVAIAVGAALDIDKAEELTGDVVADLAPAVQEIEPAPLADMREVTAARVNMRQGPSQNFTVVAKLTSGQQVEILQDPGDGWVKLRVAQSGRVGWMADFLLTASNN